MLLTWAFLHLPFGVLGLVGLAQLSEHNMGRLTAIAVLVNYTTILIIASRRTVTRMGPVVLRIRSLRSPRRAMVAAIGTVIPGLFGLLAAAAYGTSYGIGSGITLATLLILVTASSGLDPGDATRPTATFINDLDFAVVIGIAPGAYATLYYAPLYGLELALAFASMCILGSVLTSSYMRYLVAVSFGPSQGLPLRFAGFLNWSSAGLLRVSGAGYQFRH